MRRSVNLLGSIAAGILVFAAAGAAAAAALEAPKLPDSLDGRRLAAFLDAVNTATQRALQAFVEKNFSPRDLERFPAAPRVARFLRFAGEAAPLILVKVLEPTPSGPAMLVRSSRTRAWFEIRLDLSRDPSREILGIDIEDSDANAAKPEPVIQTRAQAVAAADAYLSGLARDGRFSGVALLAQQGKPFYEKAYGLADRERKIPNTAATRFNIGSINKIFTQVAIAQLASSRKLSLSDTVRKILPDYLNPNPNPNPNPPSSSPADEITVLQLINMTSGLGDIFGDGYTEAAPHLSTLEDYLKLFADKPLLFPPGKGRQYSNAGYVVLGLIIEKVSGQDYHDYVRDHIFAPAGMTSSGPSRRGITAANLAIGYSREGAGPGSQLAPNTDTLPAQSSSAGGGLSTAADLLAFDTALRAGKLLPPDWTAWIHSDKNAPPTEASSAAPESRGGLGIAGGSPGVNAALEEARDFQIVVLSNLDPPAAERAAAKFRRWLTSL